MSSWSARGGWTSPARSPATSGRTPTSAAPSDRFKLVVNVSAPAGSGLSYEAESYRITKALTERCLLEPTDLGTLDDLVETVAHARPTGLHFSGHGGPGQLLFEDDEGEGAPVSIAELARRLRVGVPGGLPPFFYLANCHGNEPGSCEEGGAGLRSLAAGLHREGITQVVGYYGPIADELSTQAEVALSPRSPTARRPALPSARRGALLNPSAENGPALRNALPFAWSQLVFYHRGPNHPLSRPAPPGWRRRPENVLHRTFQDVGTRPSWRPASSAGAPTCTACAASCARANACSCSRASAAWASPRSRSTCCHCSAPRSRTASSGARTPRSTPRSVNPIAESLVGQLSEVGRQHLGLDWEGVVQHVDSEAGDHPARRFASFLQALLANILAW